MSFIIAQQEPFTEMCQQAAAATQVVEKGRGEGGMWDVPLPPVEKKILQPQFAAKYGEAAAAASQRMFNPVSQPSPCSLFASPY